MTGKIKLNAASGGGSVSFQAPSSTGDDRIITLPTTADGTVLTTTNPKAGNIIQVVSTTKTDTFSSSSDSFTDLTGLSVTITPTSTSSKILFIASLCYGCSSDSYASGRLVRNSTPLGVAPSAGSRTVCGFSMQMNTNAANKLYSLSYQYLDSPNTTSATTYKLQGRTYSGDSRSFCINQTQLDTSINYHHRGESRVIAMEVAG